MTDNRLADIVNQLVANCREGREMQRLDELYAADAVSAEAVPMPGMHSPEGAGLAAIKGNYE